MTFKLAAGIKSCPFENMYQSRVPLQKNCWPYCTNTFKITFDTLF